MCSHALLFRFPVISRLCRQRGAPAHLMKIGMGWILAVSGCDDCIQAYRIRQMDIGWRVRGQYVMYATYFPVRRKRVKESYRTLLCDWSWRYRPTGAQPNVHGTSTIIQWWEMESVRNNTLARVAGNFLSMIKRVLWSYNGCCGILETWFCQWHL